MQETTSSAGEPGWNWVGIAETDSAGRLKIPRALLEVGVFHQHDTAHWSHEVNTGTLVVSSKPLELESYKTVGKRTIGSKEDGYRCTVPHQYTEGGSDDTHIVMQNAEPTFRGNEHVHFVFHDAALERETPWCFVLPNSEFERRLLGPADWPEAVFPESTRLL